MENNKLSGKKSPKLENIYFISQIVFSTVGIIGVIFEKKWESVVILVFILLVTVFGAVIYIHQQKYKSTLGDKQSEVKEKKEEIEFLKWKIDQQNKNIKQKNQQIDKLKMKVDACIEALHIVDIGKLTPVNKYLINRDVYDEVKTRLKILKCDLEVRLKKGDGNSKKCMYQFKWKLSILNPTTEIINKAIFIYSGSKDKKRVVVNIKVEGREYENYADIDNNHRIVGEDRFLEMNFPDGILPNKSRSIDIEYELEDVTEEKKFYIWLVPDVLGFADMDKFCIRVFCDGNFIREDTEVEFNSYKLAAEYKVEKYRRILLKNLDNAEKGFEAKSDNMDMRMDMHGYGYQLEFINKK